MDLLTSMVRCSATGAGAQITKEQRSQVSRYPKIAKGKEMIVPNGDQDDDILVKLPSWSREIYGDRCFYYDVFISHANDDGSAELVEVLSRCGLRVWYDKNQKMDDARWSMRIVRALGAARSVLCFVGSRSLEEHAWVRSEISAARAAADAAGVPRVFVVLAGTQELVPSWLAGDPVAVRYKFGELADHMILEFAIQLRNLNRVSIETSLPPHGALIERALAVQASRQHQTLEPVAGASTLKRLQELIARAFEVVAAARSGKEVNVMDASNALYLVRLASDPLWPPPPIPSFEDTKGSAARIMSEDLGLLASLPELNADSRGCAYVALERLAEAGVAHAFEVLRACLRWEWAEDLIVMVSDVLTRHPEYRHRDEAVLILVKSELLHDLWPLDLLRRDDDSVRLRHWTRLLTASGISNSLALVKRTQELTVQLDLAVREPDATRVELVLRDAIPASGIMHAWSNYFSLDANAPFDAAVVLPALVLRCARGWPPERRAELWWVPFEMLVCGPLRALDGAYGPRCRALEAMATYIATLEEPVAQHEKLLTNITETDRAHPAVQLAIGELHARRNTIVALRNAPTITRNGNTFDVKIYSVNFTTARTAWEEARCLLEYQVSDYTADEWQTQEIEQKIEVARRILAVWKGIPSC
jgi:TIR domain